MKHPNTQLVRRLQTIEGHLKKVRTMMEEGAYCMDIINQSIAVQHALQKVDDLLLEQHLRSCAVRQIKSGKTEQATKEILTVLRRRRA